METAFSLAVLRTSSIMKSSSLVFGLIFDFMSDPFWILKVIFLLLLFTEKGNSALGIMV